MRKTQRAERVNIPQKKTLLLEPRPMACLTTVKAQAEADAGMNKRPLLPP